MGIGIFLTALFGVFRLNGFFVKKEALLVAYYYIQLPPNLYILCGIRRLNKIAVGGGGGKEKISSNSIRRITTPFCKPTGRSRLPPTHHHRTHISKSDLGLGRRHTTRRIPTISYVAVPKISDTRSSLCCQRVHGNDEANKAIEAR